jgi:alkyl hydroperoxide reductase subunit AhpF
VITKRRRSPRTGKDLFKDEMPKEDIMQVSGIWLSGEKLPSRKMIVKNFMTV